MIPSDVKGLTEKITEIRDLLQEATRKGKTWRGRAAHLAKAVVLYAASFALCWAAGVSPESAARVAILPGIVWYGVLALFTSIGSFWAGILISAAEDVIRASKDSE